MEKMKIKEHFGMAGSVSWEKDDKEGYCLVQTLVTFTKDLPSGFADYMSKYINKNGIRSSVNPREYEVSGVYPNKDILFIEFGGGNTEVRHFEEYFESEEFLDFLNKGIKVWNEEIKEIVEGG